MFYIFYIYFTTKRRSGNITELTNKVVSGGTADAIRSVLPYEAKCALRTENGTFKVVGVHKSRGDWE